VALCPSLSAFLPTRTEKPTFSSTRRSSLLPFCRVRYVVVAARDREFYETLKLRGRNLSRDTDNGVQFVSRLVVALACRLPRMILTTVRSLLASSAIRIQMFALAKTDACDPICMYFPYSDVLTKSPTSDFVTGRES